MSNVNNFDEGLGTVYERFMLNSFFDSLIASYPIQNVLEVPIYGMTGLTGINSAHFVHRGCKLTMVDSKKGKINEAIELWNILPYKGKHKAFCHDNLAELPFQDKSFDLVWNFVALWHIKKADALLSEMARVSSNLVLIFVPNKKQMGYLFRKYLLDKEFFKLVDEKWADIGRISSKLTSLGLEIKDEGFLDIPPWPDTCLPIKNLLGGSLIKTQKTTIDEKSRGIWNWDIVSYYIGKNPSLKERVERFSLIEKMRLPWQLKALWAHHRYVLFSKN